MDFKIIINFNVHSNLLLEKKIKLEYLKSNLNIFYDSAEFTSNQICITGTRSRTIDVENCWKSKRSIYRKSILSSLFYAYNFYLKPIEISSITMTAGKKTIPIPFSQEFTKELPVDFSIKKQLIENVLFNRESKKHFSNLLANALQLQTLYCKQKEFYTAYRLFNATYTYIYTNDKRFEGKGNGNKDSDKIGIIAILNDRELIYRCQKSVNLAKVFFKNNPDEIRNLLYALITEKKTGVNNLSETIGYQYFNYDNYDVLNIIKQILDSYYSGAIRGKSLKNFNFKSFESKRRRENNSESTFINYLQLIVLYANHRRNKVLHGEHADPSFLISDVNNNILNEISDIIFQLGIDLVNNWIANIEEP